MSFFLKHKIWLAAVVGVAVLLIYALIASRRGDGAAAMATVGTVTQAVTISGNTKAASEVSLAFETSGRVALTPVKVGDQVKAGDLLVALDQAELLANLAENQANLAAAESALVNTDQGVSLIKVQSDEAALKEAESNLLDKIKDAYVKADDAIHNTADQFFSGPRSANPALNLNVPDPELRTMAGTLRGNLEPILTKWQNDLVTLTAPANYTDLAFGYLNQISNFLNYLALALNELNTPNATDQTIFNGYKTSVAAARTNVSAAISNLATAREKYTTAVNNLQVDESETKGQLARVDQARAQIWAVEAQLAKEVIRSPIAGVVTREEAKVGELATAGAVVAGVISADNLQIEAYVPEVNVGKVTVGNPVKITLDAFAGETFTGRVMALDPAATTIGGVPNYKVTAVFDRLDSRLKSGLSTTLVIQTAQKAGVLTIPQFAVETKAGKTFVNKIGFGGQTTLTPVTLGLVGTDGTVEVTAGLAAGDKVAVSGQ